MPEGLCQPQKGEGNGSYVPTPPPHSSTPVEKGKLLHLSEPQFPCMQTKVAKRIKGEGVQPENICRTGVQSSG